jgi:hypothetical protein
LIKTIESENRTIFARQSVNGRATVADKVSIRLKGDIVLPWDRQVLGEWNHLLRYTSRRGAFQIYLFIFVNISDLNFRTNK